MKLADFPQVIFKTTTISHGNMSLTKEISDKGKVIRNRSKYFRENNISPDDVKFMHLDLKDKVIIVNKEAPQDLVGADAAITRDKNLFLFMLTADCLPIALFDPKTESFALIHAGWQGLDLEIIKKTVNKMQQEFNVETQNLIAKIGPSICNNCYTLLPGDHPLIKKHAEDKRWQKYITKEDNKYSVDLWNFAKEQLIEVGLEKENIENNNICTYHGGEHFSHRKYATENLEYDYHIATILGIRD